MLDPLLVEHDAQLLLDREAHSSIVSESTSASTSDALLDIGSSINSSSRTIVPADVEAARVFAGQIGGPPSSRAELARYSDLLWQRYGVGSVSPALLAYWDEVCGNATGWPAPTGNDGSAVLQFLEAFHTPCAAIPRAAVTNARAVTRTGHGRLCIVLGDNDTVAPSSLAAVALASSAAVTVHSADKAHTSLDGLAACMKQLALSS